MKALMLPTVIVLSLYFTSYTKTLYLNYFNNIDTVSDANVDEIITKEFHCGTGYGGATYTRHNYMDTNYAIDRNFAKKADNGSTYFLKFDNVVDVTKIGLRNEDDGLNNRNCINDAIKVMVDKIGIKGTVYIPKGTYKLPDPIKISASNSADNVTIQGAGYIGVNKTSIKSKTGDAVLLYTSAEEGGVGDPPRSDFFRNNVTIKDIRFNANYNQDYAAYIVGACYWNLENVEFCYARTAGCYVAWTMNSSFTNIRAYKNQKTGIAIGRKIESWGWQWSDTNRNDMFTVNFTTFENIHLLKNGDSTYNDFNHDSPILEHCGIYIGHTLSSHIKNLYAERNSGAGLVIDNKNVPPPTLTNVYFEHNDYYENPDPTYYHWQFYISRESDCAIENLYFLYDTKETGYVDEDANLYINNWLVGFYIFTSDENTMNNIITDGFCTSDMYLECNEDLTCARKVKKQNTNIKMKIIEGITDNDSDTHKDHGLGNNIKLLSVTAMIKNSSHNWILSGNNISSTGDYRFDCYFKDDKTRTGGNWIRLMNVPDLLRGKPYIIIITYE